jgi:hypothetical protein
MNRRFNGKLLAILISVIALLSVASAKDYSVTAGNWQVDFKSNDTLYTEVIWNEPDSSSDLGYYTIWVDEDPETVSGRGAIYLNEFTHPEPFGKDSMRGWMRRYFSPMNETPILSNYVIDGTDAAIAEGWNDLFGEIMYGAIYPIGKDSYGFAQKFIIFYSRLDRKLNFEILDSLHVEYTDSPHSQTPAPTKTNNKVNQGRSTITTNDLSTFVKQNAPSVDKISVLLDTTQIGVSFTQLKGMTASDTTRALAAILQMYASVLNLDPTYNGYLRISYLENGLVVATFQATAYDTRANTDPTTGSLSTDYMNQVLSSGKSITYYMSDGYGDVSKAVDVPGGRAGPSQGSWL